jgi:hypothetical protein
MKSTRDSRNNSDAARPSSNIYPPNRHLAINAPVAQYPGAGRYSDDEPLCHFRVGFDKEIDVVSLISHFAVPIKESKNFTACFSRANIFSRALRFSCFA